MPPQHHEVEFGLAHKADFFCTSSRKASSHLSPESTKDMIAKIGRASRLGERTIGHQDAGATSCYLILSAMARGLTNT